jgi:hypothetical protein
MDRGEWRKICEAAKVLQELYSHGEEEEEKEIKWLSHVVSLPFHGPLIIV